MGWRLRGGRLGGGDSFLHLDTFVTVQFELDAITWFQSACYVPFTPTLTLTT